MKVPFTRSNQLISGLVAAAKVRHGNIKSSTTTALSQDE